MVLTPSSILASAVGSSYALLGRSFEAFYGLLPCWFGTSGMLKSVGLRLFMAIVRSAVSTERRALPLSSIKLLLKVYQKRRPELIKVSYILYWIDRN